MAQQAASGKDVSPGLQPPDLWLQPPATLGSHEPQVRRSHHERGSQCEGFSRCRGTSYESLPPSSYLTLATAFLIAKVRKYVHS